MWGPLTCGFFCHVGTTYVEKEKEKRRLKFEYQEEKLHLLNSALGALGESHKKNGFSYVFMAYIEQDEPTADLWVFMKKNMNSLCCERCFWCSRRVKGRQNVHNSFLPQAP